MASTEPERPNKRVVATLGAAGGRLRASWVPVLQCALAAGGAWWVAKELLGHQLPFFAPVAAVVSLGVSLGQRLRRSVELVVGVSVGIGVGDLLIGWIGTGTWQIVLVVGLAIAAAVLLDGGPVITMQAGSSAVLVATLLPPSSGAGTSRMLDTLVGGLVGVGVVALVPTHPVLRARKQAGHILETAADVLRACADGLLEQNAETIADGLERARATQQEIDDLRSKLKGGREISRISPLHWRSRERLGQLTATADPIDNAVRNIRVLARRSLSLVRDDEILDPRLVDEVERLAQAADLVRRMLLADPGAQPDPETTVAVLRDVAAAARFDLVKDAGLSANVVLAQIRSTIVDLMQVAGMERVAAIATLPPTVPNPYYPPDVEGVARD